jgi:hypothetical protein
LGIISKECVSFSSAAAAKSIPSNNSSCPLAISPGVLLTLNEGASRQSCKVIEIDSDNEIYQTTITHSSYMMVDTDKIEAEDGG